MRTSPEHVKWLLGAVTSDSATARRACKSAWKLDDEGNPVELLPAPAGEDEARMRYPQAFCEHPRESLVRLPPDQLEHPKANPVRCRKCDGAVILTDGPTMATLPQGTAPPSRKGPMVDDEQERAEHVAYWTGVVMGGAWPDDVKQHAVAALEARGPYNAATALYALGAADGWPGIQSGYKAVLRTLLESASKAARGDDRKRHCWVIPGVCNATIGSTMLDGMGWETAYTSDHG